jgi:ribosome-associated translation inhibitor RaiA
MPDTQITFHGLASSDALCDLIREKADKLRQLDPRMTRCHVTVEAPHRHHQHGNHYRVCVDLSIPGHEVVAGRSASDSDLHEDPYQAVRHAFDVARRQVLTFHQRRG